MLRRTRQHGLPHRLRLRSPSLVNGTIRVDAMQVVGHPGVYAVVT